MGATVPELAKDPTRLSSSPRLPPHGPLVAWGKGATDLCCGIGALSEWWLEGSLPKWGRPPPRSCPPLSRVGGPPLPVSHPPEAPVRHLLTFPRVLSAKPLPASPMAPARL